MGATLGPRGRQTAAADPIVAKAAYKAAKAAYSPTNPPPDPAARIKTFGAKNGGIITVPEDGSDEVVAQVAVPVKAGETVTLIGSVYVHNDAGAPQTIQLTVRVDELGDLQIPQQAGPITNAKYGNLTSCGKSTAAVADGTFTCSLVANTQGAVGTGSIPVGSGSLVVIRDVG